MTRSPGHKRHKTSAAQQTVLQRANEMFMTPVSDDEAGQLVQDAPGTSADFQYSHSSSVTESEENAQSLALNANLSNATIFEVAPRVTVLQNEECEPHDLSTRRQLITTEAPGYKNLASNVIPLPTARQISKVKKGRKEYRCEHPGCNKQASTTQRSFAAYYPTPSSDMLSPSWIDATAFATNDIYDDLPFNDANFADPMDTGSRAAQDYVLDCGDSPVDVYRWPQEVAALSQHQPDKITWSEARLERLATNYKLLRKSMWKILADKIGEDWWVVEAKVGSSCLQLKSSR
ncbi:MAG: hypothetical protein L6R41_002853 [Letrouitia leprolyta]|nr:MAG: hypothetical protein L6R41_002853 [Letrouitia leprolyta]